ncbi:MAG: iron ABC transporter permease [Leptospira sp.]|nr:iron ABC transporter permease [Leptospira sp.]
MKEKVFYAVLIVMWVLIIPIFLFQGDVTGNLERFFGSLLGNDETAFFSDQIIWDIRFPRLILGGICGAGLALSGAMVQGIFRNPLVEPGLVGISSGAALFAGLAIVFLEDLMSSGIYFLQGFAFLGALATAALVYFLSAKQGKISVITLLLMGIGINAGIGSAMGLLHYLASDNQLRAITFWNLGSLAGANWETIVSVLPFVAVLIVSVPFLAGGLNAFLIGEREALHMGYNTERIKMFILVLVCLAVGSLVSVTGVIGFIGLVVPHIVRIWGKANHIFLLPASALLGGILLIGSDYLAKTMVFPSELPIGILTAGLGAPVFIWILYTKMREEA